MKIAFFSTKPYDKEFFEKYNHAHQIDFYEVALNEQSVRLAEGTEVVCVFVNDKLNASVIDLLKKTGIQLIALRCAGFNNVDLTAAKNANIKVSSAGTCLFSLCRSRTCISFNYDPEPKNA